ncbi:MAG: acetyl-CoA carboxylase biotin carboxyl carrier protein [Terriglobia bacterium]|nr:acetyl-CoA carboxylase biotin carboxyl carrier protein [Terriglobia bacterium]
MNSKEIKELVEFLIEKDVTEFELERGDVKMRIKRGQQVQVVQAPVAPMMAAPVMAPAVAAMAAPAAPAASPVATPGPSAPATPAEEEGLHHVKSPIVGTFYEAPSPGAPPFVKPGDHVAAGQVLCIVEAMKLMNEIESDVAGEVVKALVANGQPVEYGQPLFAVRPK